MGLRGLLFFGLIAAAAPCSAAQPITLVTDEDQPYSGKSLDGKEVTGLSADVVKNAFAKAEIPYTLQVFPWARAYSMAQKQSMTCAFTAARTPERESQFKWIGPFIEEVWALYGRDDSPALTSLADAKGKIIGGNISTAISKYMTDQGLTIAEAGDDFRLNAKKLQAHRIDYWLSNATLQRYYADKLGLQGIKFIIAVKPEQGYLACNPSVSDEVVQAVNQVFLQTRQDSPSAAPQRR